MPDEIAVIADNLVKDYSIGNRRVKVLKQIKFTIKNGEYVILFGPSGSGKTTLLNMIGGLDKPSAGDIYIQGVNIAQAKSDELAYHRRIRIGMVFQDFNLVKAMTAQENVALPLIFSNVNYKQRMKRAKELLEEMGLGNRINHKPIELSGGEQQRVAIARSLVNNPWIMLIDEPTGNLDSKSANEIMKIITALNKKAGRTIILVTHNPNYLGLADRVLILDDGCIRNEMRQ